HTTKINPSKNQNLSTMTKEKKALTPSSEPVKQPSKALRKKSTPRQSKPEAGKQKLRQGSIKTWAAEERPREKMEQKGVASLTNAELLAILFRTGSKDHTAIDIAKILLKQARNDLNQLSRMNLKDLQNVHGIGAAKAITLAAALEL